MSAAAAAEYPWRAHVFGDAVTTQRTVLALASYPVLLLLVILAAFVRYLWIALAMYCALMFVFSCAARTFAARTAEAARQQQAGSRGGLSAAAIAAVAPAFPYDAAGAEAQCAVCLEAVRGGEAARRLPACTHMFHVGCIDMWLDSHATCPVCRCHVVPQKGGKESPAEPPLPPV
ncbi:RING-H2 finger protein ATL39-like [Phragmites australis]|uniref:RING-H2 finger protein ATL39-like n=1 Tax=Phragmites australis TaxID=29695 RepID=UPI002D77BE96|nr:RING-H2 finger protein ATL39-like [Phragmites australis]